MTCFRLLLLFLPLLTCIPHLMTAQQPGGGARLQGRLLDASTQEPLGFATVIPQRVADSSRVGGTLTAADGSFELPNLPAGRYRLLVSFVGQQQALPAVYTLTAGQTLPVGTLTVRIGTTQLEAVEIEAELPEFQLGLDRKIINVEQSVVAAGGTATDVLENVPGVTVDAEGAVSLRGSSNVVIWIDGKPSGLTGDDNTALRQLPANLLERIEVITNPSARFDAEGQAGIINIITKKGRVKGGNGSANVSAGTGDKYNASLQYTFRGERWDWYAGYSYRNERQWQRGRTDQRNTLPDTSYRLLSTTDGFDRERFHSLRAGGEFRLTPHQSLTFGALAATEAEAEPERIDYRFTDLAGTPLRSFARQNERDNTERNLEANLGYQRRYPDSDRSFDALLNLSLQRERADERYTETQDGRANENQRVDNRERYHSVVAQADWVLPLDSARRIEAGAKGTVQVNDESLLALDRLPGSSDAFARNPGLSNDFRYSEWVGAAYGLFRGPIGGRWSLNAGLRLEQTYTEGVSATTAQRNYQRYFSAFPSAFFQYKVSDQATAVFSYTRRVNRPRIWRVNPFINFSDTFNLFRGNPNLRPEFVNSFEAAYDQRWGDFSLTSTVFLRNTNGVVAYLRKVDNTTGVTTTTVENLNTSNDLGVELVGRYRLGKRGNLLANLNLFQTWIDGTLDADALANSGLNWNARLNANLNLTPSTDLQLVGFYRSDAVRAQGEIAGFGSMNVGVRQQLFDKRLDVTVNLSDVFNQRRFRILTETPTFVQDRLRQRESRILRVSLTYYFGRLGDRPRDDDRDDGGSEDRANGFEG